MGGRAPRDKGNRFERELVNEFRAAGLDAYRIPLSGAQTGFNGDVVIRGPDCETKIECKSRRRGFQQLYQWLEGVRYLAVKQDRAEALVVMRLSDFLRLATSPVSLSSQPVAFPKPLERGLVEVSDSGETVRILTGKQSIGLPEDHLY